MGRLPDSPFEVRLAVTSFLLVMGLAEVFGGLQVRNFAAFSPAGVAATVARTEQSTSGGRVAEGETPIDPAALNSQRHRIGRELLIQDSHVHIPAYALTAAVLAVIVIGLDLSSRWRSCLIAIAFAAPVLDFAGLWTAHLFPACALVGGLAALVGGFSMGLVYLVVLVLALKQSWLRPKGETHA